MYAPVLIPFPPPSGMTPFFHTHLSGPIVRVWSLQQVPSCYYSRPAPHFYRVILIAALGAQQAMRELQEDKFAPMLLVCAWIERDYVRLPFLVPP